MTVEFRAGQSGGKAFHDVQCMMDATLQGWSPDAVQISRGPGRGEHRFIDTDKLRLDGGHWSTGMLVCGTAAPNTIGIGLVSGATSHAHFRGRPVAPGKLPLVQPGAEFEFSTSGPVGVLVLTIDKSAFARHTEALWREEMPPASAHLLSLPGMDECMAVANRLDSALRELHRQPALLESPRVAALVTDDILTSLLGSVVPPPQRVDLAHRHHQARQAAAMLRGAGDHPVSIKELCGHLRIGWRALDIGFREVYGISPKAYLRVSRLHHVRRILATADPATVTVTTVAATWGFFQLGRFAVEYRQLFGEKPSDTLWKKAGAKPYR